MQRSSEPKSEEAPNNFYQPVAEHDRIDGDFSNQVLPSITDLLDKNPILQWGAVAGAVAVAFIAAQTITPKE
ncbi:hypothetical protein RIVM261_061960 [Rivularia sp. IAM M-261]|nr:hypothetical protein CAL7716_048150 [Calothrix sp. PCC 7716]GJD21240.1 hypothetical protein RIVM261_061960 [Rivularia sp. IAM M-261]